LILVRSLVSERLARRQLAKAYEQIYQHSLQIEDKAVLEERTRIARDIHDTLGHLLVAQHIQLENALLSIQTPAEQAPFLEESKKLGSKALYNLRQVVSILRSEPEETLDQIVDEIVGEFKRSSKIKTVFEAELPRLPSRKLQLAVKGILSEALTNVQKHSGATEVSILIKVLSISEQELLYIEIVDNGRGVDLENSSSGFGLQNMRERAENIGGWLEINGQKGCKVAASLPVEG
ncbi:MAG: sensor histidine kinase, partial [Blastocatellia bacterium]|nr:sensor histidine kinase [Blastocatellia bacterium]